ncbi:flavodoxin family protein [Acetobacterium paludosum]|uniref:Flavodoxin family protein n=1 Tax=Acetobacterium paludosum TaxID=52693 RepID=A0A923HX91_9FIRM|nr:NAD(P)H-dependent oxidoreductase [Acetobacterium paludosum]MBC3888865.1 flavodoxin family protein [Acetobacterium paludosum]
MKIAVLLGSPRKQDSYTVCKQIENQIKEMDNDIEFDYIYLSKYNIQDCKGCCLCFQKSENCCPCRDDDLTEIKARLFSADGLIVASPVYAYQVTGQLKRFIDRMSYLFHRQEMVGKPAIIVITTDGGGSKQVYKYLKMTLSGWSMDIVGNIQITAPLYFENRTPKSVFGYDPYYFQQCSQKIKTVSLNLFKRLKATDKRVPTFYDIFMFNCLRSKTYTSKIDRDYWIKKGWIESDYFYAIKLNPLKKAFGQIIKNMVHLAGKRYLKLD